MKEAKRAKMKGKNTGCSEKRLKALRIGVKKREERRKEQKLKNL